MNDELKNHRMRMLAQYVLSVLTNPGEDNMHTDMERIGYAAIDLGLVEYNVEKDELVKKEL